VLISCASTVQLSAAAKAERDRMTPQQAEQLLAKYARPDASRGGLCLIGIRALLTQLEDNSLVDVSGSVISFDAYFAKLSGASVRGNVAAGTGQVSVAYSASHGSASVDMKTLREIRILETKPQTLALCPHFKPGYLVAVTGDHSLPDQAQISINATSPAELDSVLAMLTYFSPHANVVGGIGM
jgi:hypothetical protein